MRIEGSDGELILGNKDRMKKKLFQIANAEARLWLFRRMLDQDLATRDIQAFIDRQAELRRDFIDRDLATLRSAMRAKYKDTSLNLRSLRDEICALKKDLLADLDCKKFRLRKLMKDLKSESMKLKNSMIMKYEKKIKHLRSIQKPDVAHTKENRRRSQTTTPYSLAKYKDLTIFKPSTQFPQKEKPLGPFICDPTLALSKEERLILSKQPKFSVREEVTELKMLAETERMLTKHRFGRNNTLNKEKKRERDITGDTLLGVPDQTPQSERDKKIEEIWRENRDRFIFNPFEKTINFNSARPTDYILNKHINMPKPLSPEEELECELRRRGYMKAFTEYEEEKKKEGHIASGMKGSNTLKNKKNAKTEGEALSNLTGSEKKGLKSILERIDSGELCIAQTDKSGRLAVLNNKQYLQTGAEHTSKDKELSWNNIKYLQNQINNNVWWLSEILGISLKRIKIVCKKIL